MSLLLATLANSKKATKLDTLQWKNWTFSKEKYNAVSKVKKQIMIEHHRGAYLIACEYI